MSDGPWLATWYHQDKFVTLNSGGSPLLVHAFETEGLAQEALAEHWRSVNQSSCSRPRVMPLVQMLVECDHDFYRGHSVVVHDRVRSSRTEGYRSEQGRIICVI